ncbi:MULTISPECIES: nucleoside triphosphate pyrophosphatase [unclassified Thioalkalivibrio]|uniref:Maf family protein n=1 Tax=unclassified Thioalkalivibrio TaxID=2621013 RepID=UPI00037180C6|nr:MULTISPECIES: Maf family protein [unclassified Thioalkalivibrio]
MPVAHPLLLASASPRRRELLEQVQLVFEVAPMDVDETPLPGESPEALVERLAIAKAEAALERGIPGQWVLAADTVVALGDEALGKPVDFADAESMLQRLSGGEHRVVSGMALCRPGESMRACTVTTRVRMRPLTPSDIERYWATGEPLGKAGAYAIQGRGAAFVEWIAGSYTNVVGLPLFELEQWLAAIPDPPPRRA